MKFLVPVRSRSRKKIAMPGARVSKTVCFGAHGNHLIKLAGFPDLNFR